MARKPLHEEHENLERWLVSYADFITLLFAFFVVMYSISQVNESKYKVLSDALINAFKNAPTSPHAPLSIQTSKNTAGAQAQKAIVVKKSDVPDPNQKKETEKMKAIAKDLTSVMEKLVKQGQVKVTQSSKGIVVEINASVLFASGQAVLQEESIKVLTAVAKVLADVPNHIQVEGHTDNAPISNVLFPSNWELSAARASSVVRLFEVNGVAPERLVAVGYGEHRPVESNSTPEGRARNRRVTVLIMSAAQQKITDISLAAEASRAAASAAPQVTGGQAGARRP